MFSFFKKFKLPRRHKTAAVLAKIVLIFSSSSAQPLLKPNLDVAQFQDKAGQSYIEIYYSLPEAAFAYAPDNAGGQKCRLLLALQIHQDRALWASKNWKIEKALAASGPLLQQNSEGAEQLQKSQHVVDALNYLVDKPGRYRIALHVKDLNAADRVDSASVEFDVRRFSAEKLEVSDLELASMIGPGAAAAAFTKHEQEVIPNAAALFGEGVPKLYYYFEVYNLMQNVPGRKYKTLCRIQSPDGAIVEGIGNTYRTKLKRFNSSVEMGMFDVAQLPSGKYSLVYGIADSVDTLLARREKTFFVYNPAVPPRGAPAASASDPDALAGPLHDLDEKALEEEFAKMVYLSTPNDRKFYKHLANAEAKREYIFSLWKSAPADGALNPLAYRQQYLARAQYAGQRYQTPNRPGWKTDRGRAFILYGSPTHVDRFPSSTTTLPFETWTYDNLKGQGGVIFVFADRAGFGNYEQIHSTLQGELQDPNWQRLIMRGSSDANRTNAIQ